MVLRSTKAVAAVVVLHQRVLRRVAAALAAMAQMVEPVAAQVRTLRRVVAVVSAAVVRAALALSMFGSRSK